MIIDHETVVSLIELADQVAVVGTEYQKAHPVTYCREVKRFVNLFHLKTSRFKNESHRILGFFPHFLFHHT